MTNEILEELTESQVIAEHAKAEKESGRKGRLVDWRMKLNFGGSFLDYIFPSLHFESVCLRCGSINEISEKSIQTKPPEYDSYWDSITARAEYLEYYQCRKCKKVLHYEYS